MCDFYFSYGMLKLLAIYWLILIINHQLCLILQENKIFTILLKKGMIFEAEESAIQSESKLYITVYIITEYITNCILKHDLVPSR